MGRGCGTRGFPGLRPSGPPSATTPMARRWPPWLPGKVHRIALPEVAPLDVIRRANGCLSVRPWKNVMDGTPGGAPYFREVSKSEAMHPAQVACSAVQTVSGRLGQVTVRVCLTRFRIPRSNDVNEGLGKKKQASGTAVGTSSRGSVRERDRIGHGPHPRRHSSRNRRPVPPSRVVERLGRYAHGLVVHRMSWLFGEGRGFQGSGVALRQRDGRGARHPSRVLSRVGGSGLERTCRLKPMLGTSASPNATRFGPNIV
jgi:hypothetical protein